MLNVSRLRAGQPTRRTPVVTGLCSASDSALPPGTLAVATELDGVAYPAARAVAAALRRHGLAVEEQPVACADRIAADPPPLAVVVAATAADLERAGPVLDELSAAVRSRTLLVAAPRASCAGVDRAVRTVELALERFGPPVYVRHEIVHNVHVVAELERRGARFVDEVTDVPSGANVLFSAHGVAPEVRAAARERGLNVIDATCPLVSKVHAEARRFAGSGHTVVLIGHADHEEVVGTRGEAPEQTVVVEDADDVAALEVDDPERIAYLTQTTLAIDETADTLAALRERFPALAGPHTSDICFATQNRQDAVKVLAAESDLVLVIGSQNSSNARRLVEVAERHGASAALIEDDSAIEPAWLQSSGTIGITAGASTPEALVQQVLDALSAFGPAEIEERRTTTEDVTFRPPPVR